MGRPRGGSVSVGIFAKHRTAPPCLGEALRRGILLKLHGLMIFMVWVRTLCSCLFLLSRFYKKKVFNNVPGTPYSLRGTMRTSSAPSRRARVTATRSVCPFREKKAMRILIGIPPAPGNRYFAMFPSRFTSISVLTEAKRPENSIAYMPGSLITYSCW